MNLQSNIIAVCLAFGLLACSESKEEVTTFVRPVKYVELSYSNNDLKRTFSGKAATDKIINLSFRNQGIITKFDIKLGQKVEKGQLLASLDNVQARLSYEQALTRLNSAASQMNTAQLNLERVRKLYEKGSIALSTFESAKNGYTTAKESYKSAKRGVALQEEQIQFGHIYAPEDGVISSIKSEIEENVNQGQVVAVLNAGADMEITLGLPENLINTIKVGTLVDVEFPSLKGQVYPARITEVAPAINSQTATYPVKVTLIQSTNEVKTGMAANVSFNFSDNQHQANDLIVPSQAVGEDNKGRFVLKIVQKGSQAFVQRQYIKIGKFTSKGFVVLSGLIPGDKIATAGLQTLLDGQEVKL